MASERTFVLRPQFPHWSSLPQLLLLLDSPLGWLPLPTPESALVKDVTLGRVLRPPDKLPAPTCSRHRVARLLRPPPSPLLLALPPCTRGPPPCGRPGLGLCTTLPQQDGTQAGRHSRRRPECRCRGSICTVTGANRDWSPRTTCRSLGLGLPVCTAMERQSLPPAVSSGFVVWLPRGAGCWVPVPASGPPALTLGETEAQGGTGQDSNLGPASGEPTARALVPRGDGGPRREPWSRGGRGPQASGPLRRQAHDTHSPCASRSAWPLNIAWNEGKGEKVLLLCGDSLAQACPPRLRGEA